MYMCICVYVYVGIIYIYIYIYVYIYIYTHTYTRHTSQPWACRRGARTDVRSDKSCFAQTTQNARPQNQPSVKAPDGYVHSGYEHPAHLCVYISAARRFPHSFSLARGLPAPPARRNGWDEAPIWAATYDDAMPVRETRRTMSCPLESATHLKHLSRSHPDAPQWGKGRGRPGRKVPPRVSARGRLAETNPTGRTAPGHIRSGLQPPDVSGPQGASWGGVATF